MLPLGYPWVSSQKFSQTKRRGFLKLNYFYFFFIKMCEIYRFWFTIGNSYKIKSLIVFL